MKFFFQKNKNLRQKNRPTFRSEMNFKIRSNFLGSYHDKITHLDNALQNFTRLQNLDLARNALLSLDGLSHLRHLETLNLYYNNVCDLDELYKLKNNKKLENIDLRLNPGNSFRNLINSCG